MQSCVHVSVSNGQMWELLATTVVSLFVVLENSFVVVLSDSLLRVVVVLGNCTIVNPGG